MAIQGWKDMTLGEVLTLQRGYDLPLQDQKPGDFPIMGSAGPNGTHNVARAKGPGVVIGRSGVGSMGVASYCAKDFWPHNTTLFVTDFKGNDPRFIYYFLTKLNLRGYDSGSAQASLNRNFIYPIEVTIPDPAEQRRISQLLGSLDDKIEQNRRTGRALEGLARATFKAWFVDFEPVKAKAAGQTSFPVMPPAAFAALPDRLTDSPLGPVPQGWEVRPLSEVCQIVSGGTPKRSEAGYWGGSIPWYSVKDAPPDGMPWVYFTDEQITEAGLDGSAATLVPVGCTIISARGTVGRLALAGRPMTFNQSCYGLLPKDGKSYRHLYLLVRQVVSELQQRSHGSVFDTITRQTFEGVKVVLPPPALIGRFEFAVTPLFDSLLALLRESTKLAELRDYLLPRLLSGTVRVEAQNG